ncbi:Predicted hydrolase, HAD superfamily [Methylobacterium sp. UNC378MF]|nr:Predicted hydrolase, HAD superfamily [Methylobacterium sp. UNC378MF]
MHFAMHGQFEGRRPSIYFDPDFYMQERERSDSVSSDDAAGGSDFLHYLTVGWKAGLDPSRFFSTSWYVETNRDAPGVSLCPLYHFATRGLNEGRLPARDVDVDWYINKYDLDPNDKPSAYASMVESYPKRAVSELDYHSRCQAPAANISGAELSLIFLGNSEASDLLDLAPAVPDGSHADAFSDIVNFELITLDVWDTILRRDCHPDEIKLQSARFLYLRAMTLLKPFFKDVNRLLTARLQSEAATSSGEDREFQLAAAFRYWLNLTLDTSVNRDTISALVQQLLEHELVAEKRSTRLDQPAGQFLRQQCAPVVFVSDFYADRQFVKNLLEFHGVGRYMLGGYVSSDYHQTKRSGKLFEVVRQDLRIIPERWAHIGDNEVSDHVSPRSAGILSRLYTNNRELERSRWFAQAFEKYRSRNLSLHEKRIASLICEHANSLVRPDKEHGRFEQVGAQFAMIAVGFILSVLEDAVVHDFKRIYFFTREGAFFRRLAQVIVQNDPYNVNYPELELLKVSRVATFAASLCMNEQEDLMRLWRQYSTQSLRDFSISLGLDEGAMQNLGRRHSIDWFEPIQYPWRDNKFKALLSDKTFNALITNRVRKQGGALKNYLATQDFGKTPAAAEMIVDVGWRGTIQDNLAHLTSVAIRGHYLGLFRFLNPQPKFSHKIGYLFDENGGRSHRGIVDEVAPLEMIYNTLGGSVLEYDDEGGICTPRRRVEPGEERIVAEYVSHMQEGMLSCAEIICKYIKLHGLTSKDLLNLAQSTAASLCAQPPTELADAFFELKHNESFGAGQVQDLGLALEQLRDDIPINALGSSEVYQTVSAVASGSRWKNGLFATSRLARLWDEADARRRLSLPSSFYMARTPRTVALRGQSVSVYCPPPLAGSGGHRTIFNVVRSLAQFGLNIQCFADGTGDGLALIEEWLDGTTAHLHSQWHGHVRADFALATVAHSAKFVAELPHARHKGYLVQDLESLFNPVSDRYLIAENSYQYGLRHYTVGNWLSHRLYQEYSSQTVPAGLGVDTDIYRIDASAVREKAVCFLYQPDKWRRLPQVTLDALTIVSKAVPDAKIYMFGSDARINPGFRVENLGLINDLKELNRLYNTCEVGLCLSMSNPSRIPFEMMAAGCLPVDLYRNNNLFDYVDDSALLAYQSAESIADAVVTLLRADSSELGRRREKARNFASGRSLAWESETIANHIVSQILGEAFIQHKPSPAYRSAPHIAPIDDNAATRWFCTRQMQL